MKKLILLICLFTSFNVIAADADDEEDDEEIELPKITSAMARSGKEWGWIGQVGNLSFVNKSTLGFGFGFLFYADGDNIFSVEAGAGSNFDFVSNAGGDTVYAYDQRLGFYYRTFPANSFYFKTGVEVNRIHYEVDHKTSFNGPSSQQEADITLYSASIGIGNHWQIRKLTLGCDWFTLMAPLVNSNFSESNTAPGSSRSWDLKTRLTSPNFVVARFYMGMSF